MAKNIKVDSLELMFAVAQMKLAGAALDTTLDTWTSQGENSVALEAYAQQYVELERTMKLLEDLVQQDANDVAKASAAMFLSEMNLAQLWK